MRLVIDTNVFVSAALKEDSLPAETIRQATRYDVLLKSMATERELLAVLMRPRFAGKIAPLFLDRLRQILDAAELVSITQPVTVCRDPEDNKFVELAVAGRADVIVSGDNDLLALAAVGGIPVVTPAAFIRTSRRNPQ